MHNEIKNSIENLYISDQKKKKTICRTYYKNKKWICKITERNSALKIELQKYRDYIQNKPQKSYQKPSYQKL